MANLSKLSDEELVAKNEELMTKKDGIRAEQVELNTELNARALEVKTQAFLDSLTPDQLSAVNISGKTAEGSGGK